MIVSTIITVNVREYLTQKATEKNIFVINEYLNMLLKVSLEDISWRDKQNENMYNIQHIFEKCWDRLDLTGNIYINELLGEENSNNEETDEIRNICEDRLMSIARTFERISKTMFSNAVDDEIEMLDDISGQAVSEKIWKNKFN